MELRPAEASCRWIRTERNKKCFIESSISSLFSFTFSLSFKRAKRKYENEIHVHFQEGITICVDDSAKRGVMSYCNKDVCCNFINHLAK